MTALLLYGTTAVSSTLSTAAKLANATGGTATTVNTSINAGNGYYELLGLGGTSSANASLPAPTGNGWLWDVTTLEAQTIGSGTWTLIGTISIASGTLGSSTLTLRAYKRSSGGVYTALCASTSSTFTVSTTNSVESLTASGVSSMAFSTGDKLYADAFLNGNPGSARSIQFSVSSTGSGVAQCMEMDSPGYSATVGSTHIFLCDGMGGVFR